jgi:hypothetical protein
LESNVNVLSSVDNEHCDPIGGSWANRGLLCKVYRVQATDKVDTGFAIPGSASAPGVTVAPSEQPLAYEPIPYDPKPSFELPEGLYWDPATKIAWDLERGLIYDPESGWLYHPETYVYYDVATRYAYDPTTETLVDEAGQRYDMTTKEPVELDAAAAAISGETAAAAGETEVAATPTDAEGEEVAS